MEGLNNGYIVKTEKTLSSIGGQWIAEYYIMGKDIFGRAVHIDYKTGKRTFEGPFEQFDPWADGVEMERIKNL